MRSTRTSPLRARLLWALTLLIVAAAIPAPAARAALPPAAAADQHDDVLAQADGSYTLSPSAGRPPAALASFQRFGTLTSAPVDLGAPATRIQLNYQAFAPAGTSLQVDLRGSLDGRSWTPWVAGLPEGAVVGFARPITQAQYRVSLLGSLAAAPAIRSISVSPTTLSAERQAVVLDSSAVAPTFRIRATRQGMVGGRTANGYIIPPRARFVSLPSWSALSTRGVDEYKVRISYRGRTSIVPVYDVGPYSGRDDYWDAARDGYPELERGWPMDHAAYYEGYNGGQADKGYVRFPTAMDVGDGAWWDDLGIVGDQAEVEVTFLWLGRDPLAGPAPRDASVAEQVVDELGADFWHNVPWMSPSPVGCGLGRHAYRATSVSDPAASATVARWQPQLPAEGMYDLFVHVPICPSKAPPVTLARYVIQHRDGAVELAVNQREQTGWVHLGRYPFSAGGQAFIQLSDLAGEAGGTVWFDQARWVRVP